MKTHYQRNLPHILPPGQTIFITFRLAGSLPKEVIERLIEEKTAFEKGIDQRGLSDEERQEEYRKANKRYFARFDEFLAKCVQGPHWLNQTAIAELVKEGIHYRDGNRYTLHAYSIMPNHIHLLITIPDDDVTFYRVLQFLKRHTAQAANRLLNRTGQSFWHPESYDHLVRNRKEFQRIVEYILNNPVKAGLVASWEQWPHSYLAP